MQDFFVEIAPSPHRDFVSIEHLRSKQDNYASTFCTYLVATNTRGETKSRLHHHGVSTSSILHEAWIPARYWYDFEPLQYHKNDAFGYACNFDSIDDHQALQQIFSYWSFIVSRLSHVLALLTTCVSESRAHVYTGSPAGTRQSASRALLQGWACNLGATSAGPVLTCKRHYCFHYGKGGMTSMSK